MLSHSSCLASSCQNIILLDVNYMYFKGFLSSGSATKKQVKCLLAQRKTDSDDFSRANKSFWNLVKKQLDHQLVIVDEVITDPTRLGIQEPGTVLIVPCLNSSRLVTDVEGVVKHWSLGQQQGMYIRMNVRLSTLSCVLKLSSFGILIWLSFVYSFQWGNLWHWSFSITRQSPTGWV